MLTIDDLQEGTVIKLVNDSGGVRYFVSGMRKFLGTVCTVDYIYNSHAFTTIESGAFLWPIEAVACIIDNGIEYEMQIANESEVDALLFGKV